MSNITKKTMAIAMAAAVSVAGPVGAGMLAPSTAIAAPGSAIDTTRTGSITINKYEGQPGDTATPLPGTTFQVEQINLQDDQLNPHGYNLDRQQAWDVVAKWADNVAGAPAGGYTGTQTTGADGTTKFDQLPVGLYRVTEQARGGGYTVAPPFLVTIPRTDDGDPSYDVTVSPKNQKLQPTKKVETDNYTVGDDVQYNVSTTLPAFEANRQNESLQVVDTMPAELTWDANNPNHTVRVAYYDDSAAEAADVDGTAGTALEAGTDYNVTLEAGNKLTVSFTEAGITKLREARATNPELALGVRFKVTVTTAPDNGVISNTAEVIYNGNPTNTTDPRDPENPGTETQFVNVAVTKQLAGKDVDDNKNGSGAKFEIYRCTQDSSGRWNIADGAQPERVRVNDTTVTEITATGADGQAAVANVTGLNRAKADRDANSTAVAYVDYCALETAGVAGYLDNPEPQHLEFTAAAGNGAAGTLAGTVNNAKNNIWGNLPATGERTMLILLAIGAILFAGGAAYQLNRRNAA